MAACAVCSVPPHVVLNNSDAELLACLNADHALAFTLTANGEWVDSGVNMTFKGSNVSYTGGTNSYVWLAKLTFTVPPGNDALLVVVDT